MHEPTLHDWALHLAQHKGFALGELIYQGEYYAKEKVRDVIFAVTYNGQSAVLKLYDDPRLTEEPWALEQFHQHNTSTLLTAPKLYDYEMVSPHKGWLIMERLPAGGSFFQSPLTPSDRQQFLRAYREYRRIWPVIPWRKLTLVESLSADKRYLFSVSRWLELANNKEADRRLSGDAALLAPEQFLPRYSSALDVISAEYATRQSLWCHGHFKPKEVYRAPDGRLYLTDFAHASMCPEGYEFGFMVWADWLMGADWQMSYPEWKSGIDAWVADFTPLAHELRIVRFPDLVRASLLDRVLGAMLADITASDRPIAEKQGRLALLYQLLDDLL